MPEAYGGVTVDYCLGQKLNANQDEEYAKWNTEEKIRVQKNIYQTAIFSFVPILEMWSTLNSKCVCVCLNIYRCIYLSILKMLENLNDCILMLTIFREA